MPAIDVPQVRYEISELAQLYADPEQFSAAVREFFQAHGLPTLKQSTIVSVQAPLKTYGTPLPVMRLLVSGLRRIAVANPQLTLNVVRHLWAEPVREQRRLAIELLTVVMSVMPDDAASLMNLWLISLDDLELTELLAAGVGGQWLAADLQSRLVQARFWINSPHKYQRQFGVTAVAVLAKLRNFDDVSSALNVLIGTMRENDPEVRKSVARAICDLSTRQPGEAARFLRQWADTLDKNTQWIVRHAMEKLDADAQTQIRALLRGSRRV